MPYAPTLPTTGVLSFPAFLSSSTHPSLPVSATVQRNQVRASLKRHKRLPSGSQAAHLPEVLNALNGYLPYLQALDAGLCGQSVPTGSSGFEEVDVVLRKEVECEWRATLSPTLPRLERQRVKLKGLESEILFVHFTLANVYCLVARERLRPLVDPSAASLPSEQERIAAASTAMQNLVTAHTIFTYASTRAEQTTKASVPPDIEACVLSALASLALGEATLAAVLKDDAFAAAAAQDRHKHDKEWMFKAPDMPRARAAVFTRLCVAAADHAARGSASAAGNSGMKLGDELPKFLDDLRRTARARACRFQGIEAEAQAETGKGIAWLRCARIELGLGDSEGAGKLGGLSRLKKGWTERREDRKVEKGGEWGSDAGRAEEARVVEMLLTKWEKENDTINVQIVPPTASMFPNMPSGRDCHTPPRYVPPSLDESTLRTLRGPPDSDDERTLMNAEDDSDAENADDAGAGSSEPVGAFPGTGYEYGKSGTPAGSSPYY